MNRASVCALALVLLVIACDEPTPKTPSTKPPANLARATVSLTPPVASRKVDPVQLHRAGTPGESRGRKATVSVWSNLYTGGRMLKQLVLIGVCQVMLSAGGPQRVEAQAYISTTSHRVPFSRLDSLQKLLKANKAVTEEMKRRGGVLDNTWLIHAWGGEYNVVQMVTWKSWAAIADTTLGAAAATRKVYPDSTQRKRVTDAFNWVFEGVPHVDNIYQKVE